MTFVIKHRGAPRLIRADFRCPTHGPFTALVDSGTDVMPCPVDMWQGLKLDGHVPMTCNRPSPWSPQTAPVMRMRRVEATRGGIERPEHRDWDFQRNLEDGQDPTEWQDERDAAAERRREQLVMDMARSD